MNTRNGFCFTEAACKKLIHGALSMLLLGSWLAPGQVAAEISENIALTVNYGHPVPVNLKKYGVNGALLGAETGYGNEALVDIYKQIGIVFSRYPGGTIGNYYQWKTGRFACDKTPDERTQKRIAQMNRSLEKKKTTYALDDFLEFEKKTGGDFTYVLNTMCASPENNAELLNRLKKGNVGLNYVELANEAYSKGYAWAYPSARAYLDSARENHAVIKANYPAAKVGLIVSPLSFSGKQPPGKNGVPNKSWPDRFRQFDAESANASFADALIIHVYGEPYDGKFWSIDPKTNKEHFLKVAGQFNDKFDLSMDYLKQLGKGKPIWITEWGVTADEEKQQGVFKEYIKSAYQALYMASGFVSITLEEGVEMANYHNARDLWQTGKQRTEITPLGNVLRLFMEAAKNANTVYRVQAETNQKTPGKAGQVNGLKSVLFASDKGGDLLVINEQDKGFVIKGLDAGKSRFNNFSVDALIMENDVFKTARGEPKKLADIAKAGIEVKPFSILRIRLY